LLGELSPGVVIFVFNIVIGRISGDTGISAYSIMANIMLVVISVFNGFAQGIQPIISTNYGADNSIKIKESMRYVVFIAAGFSAALFLGQTLFSGELTSMFTRDSGTLRDLSVRALTIGAFAYLFLGINMVEISKFQSKEKTRISTGLSLLKGFVFVLTNLAILPKMFSLDGVWLSIPLAEFCTFILILIFNRKEHTDYLSRGRINE
ncbi:MAG: MATE family efflux transporter, partial [Clostridiaceae bacterium]